jgi:hypothetical protein
VCEQYFPVIHAPGDVALDGGMGQGILLVDGDLLVRGDARFVGLVVVRGRIELASPNASLTGAVLVASARGARSTLQGRVSFSSCALWWALAAHAAPVPVEGRAWAELY